MPQHHNDIHGNEIKIGDVIKIYNRPNHWTYDQYEQYLNRIGFQNGIGTVTKIKRDFHWVCVNDNIIGWNSKVLEIIPQYLYQHILRSI